MNHHGFMHVDQYVAASEDFESNGAANDPQWARSLRKVSIARFKELGFPVARRGNEEWKYTDVGPIAKTTFQPVVVPVVPWVEAYELERFTLGMPLWNNLVFVDGSYAEALSSTQSLPADAIAVNLAQAMRTQAHVTEQHLARHASYEPDAFTALNTAFVHDGGFVHIPDGMVVEEPIHLLFLFTASGRESAIHPRVLVVVGKGSKATIIESYGALADSRYLSNSVTEVVVGEGSTVEHYRVQRHSKQAFHIGTTQAELARDSRYISVVTDMGGGLTRNNLNVLMAGEGSSCMLNGVYILNETQHVDNQVIIDHAMPYTSSRELYKGILDDRSRSVFHGSIIVREGAKKVDAHQEDKNLLLSDKAEADTKPAFWIYTDDVRCGHGAACGQMDESALFYLRSRGVDEIDARRLLMRAFVTEVINSVPNDSIRAYLDELVMAKLLNMIGDENTT